MTKLSRKGARENARPRQAAMPERRQAACRRRGSRRWESPSVRLKIQQTGDARNELARIHGLRQMHLVTGQQRALTIIGARVSGQSNGRRACGLSPFARSANLSGSAR